MTHTTINTNAKILTTGDQEYWDDVKRRTRFRNAHEALDRNVSKMRSSQIYEQYVNDHMIAVRNAALQSKLTDEIEYAQFKEACAKKLRMPELMQDEGVIAACASEAISEVHSLMYEE